MAEFMKVIHDWKRFCKARNSKCETCPLHKLCGHQLEHESIAAQIEDHIMKWARENPEPTILEDFLSKFPNATLEYGFPVVCAARLGYVEDTWCSHKDCRSCWKTPFIG